MKNTIEVNALESQSNAISSFILKGLFKLLDDQVGASSGPELKSLIQNDISKHLRHLGKALEQDSVEQFVNYILWSKGILQTQNRSISNLSDCLSLMKSYCESEAKLFHQSIRYLNEAQKAFKNESKSMSIIDTSTQFDVASSKAYLASLVQGNSREAWDSLQQSLAKDMSYSQLGTQIVQPAMYKVGDLWEANKITVAHEHLASSITQNALAKSLTLIEYEMPNDRPAIFSCIAGNHHMIGLRIIADTFELAGWDVTFLGANTPSNDIIHMIRQLKPELLGLSVALTDQLPTLKSLTSSIHKEFGANRPFILVGGLATNQLGGMLDDIQVDQWIPHSQAINTQLAI